MVGAEAVGLPLFKGLHLHVGRRHLPIQGAILFQLVLEHQGFKLSRKRPLFPAFLAKLLPHRGQVQSLIGRFEGSSKAVVVLICVDRALVERLPLHEGLVRTEVDIGRSLLERHFISIIHTDLTPFGVHFGLLIHRNLGIALRQVVQIALMYSLQGLGVSKGLLTSQFLALNRLGRVLLVQSRTTRLVNLLPRPKDLLLLLHVLIF